MIDQKIFLNSGLSKLNLILNQLKVNKIFIVCGSNSFLPISLSIKKQLNKYQICFFNPCKTNPTIKNIHEGIIKFNNFNPDLIIAIGGGYVIDMAKLIKTFAKEKNILDKIIQNKINHEHESNIPFVVLPTTAGSGSESTSFAVFFHEKKKYSLSSSKMLANYIILDVELVKTMPDNIAYSSLFDALSQAVESYWSKFATNLSDEYALRSINLILDNFNEYVFSRSYKNITKIIQASNFSGVAINITKTTAPHALSYVLTSYFGIPHGNAVAILLPETFRISFHRMVNLNRPKCMKILSLFQSKNIDCFCEKWINYMKACRLSTKVRDFGVKPRDIDFIVNEVNSERLKGNPIELTESDLREIVRKII